MYELLKTLPHWLQVSLLFLPAVSLLIATCAFVFNARQTFLNNRLTRATIVADNLNAFLNDEVMHKAFYEIEYSHFTYDENFHGSEKEPEIDKLLRHFSNLALMWKDGFLKLSDIHPVQYFILRITNDTEIQKYLEFIQKWSGYARTGSHPYVALIELNDKLNKKCLTRNWSLGKRPSSQAKINSRAAHFKRSTITENGL